MKLEEKVEVLNDAVKGSLSITYYVDWELRSYADNTLFNTNSESKINSDSFAGLIEKAYNELQLSLKGEYRE